LADIIENIDAIIAYTANLSLDQFMADRKTVDATECCLERITEATIKIGPERMAIIAPGLSASAVRGFGNFLRHHYDAVDLSVIFTTVKDDLPILYAACLAALKEAP
jgi:uncharacterized protein with HEPN domain